MTKYKIFDTFYSRSGARAGENNNFQIAKPRERKNRDLNNIRCIKGKNISIPVNDMKIKKR